MPPRWGAVSFPRAARAQRRMGMTYTRRGLLKLSGGAAVAAILAACSPSAAPAASAPAASAGAGSAAPSAAPVAGKPVYGGTLIVAQQFDGGTQMDPQTVAAGGTTYLTQQIHDSLLSVDDKGQPQPW